MRGIGIPSLKDIPFFGDLLFNQTPMVYIAFALAIFTSIFFNKTRAGLNYKAVGEHPQAAATLGIPVVRIKYLSCVICGALSGIGGTYLTTCYSSTYSQGNIAGRGFIALAAVIFGRWTGGGVVAACLFFGFCDALQIRLQVGSFGVPYQSFQMLPYLATIIALTAIGSKQAGPKTSGKTVMTTFCGYYIKSTMRIIRMKKFLALILALAMALSLMACGQKDAPADGGADGKQYKVAMICDSSISDGGWGAACYNAMVDAAGKMGWTYEVTDSIA